MVIKQSVKIPALSQKTRDAYFYLPVGYGESGCRYPVMYMFDGQNLFSDADAAFGKSWGLADYLDYTDTPLIIAAVASNTEGHGRLSEYSPVNFVLPDGIKVAGKGKKYMEWLVREFKPYVDENFLTLPQRENTAVGGSSMGGLMAVYALARYGKYFSKAAALSPSLWVDPDKTADLIKKAAFKKDAVIYAGCGSREFAGRPGQREAFAGMCSVLINKGVNLTSRVVPGGIHSEDSWGKQIPYFMNALGFYPEN